MFPDIFEVILLAMSPIIHSGAVPLGLAIRLSPPVVLLASVLGNFVSVSALLLSLGKLDTYLKGMGFYERTVERTRTSCHRYVDSYGAVGLLLFVITPGFGSWMGCIAAFITGMNKKIALVEIVIGIIVSEMLILGACLGLISIWNNFFLDIWW